MVEEPVVLVVVDEDDGAPPHIGVPSECVQHLVDDRRAVHRRGDARVLGVHRRRDQVGDLGQRPRRDVLGELVGECARPDPAQPPVEKTAIGSRQGRDTLVEQPQQPLPLPLRVRLTHGGVEGLHVGVAAGPRQGFAGDGLEGGEELDLVVGEVLPLGVRLPAPPGLLQTLGVGAPVVSGVAALVVRVVAHGPPAVRLGAGRPAPQMVAVGAGGGVDRGVVGVADREGVGEFVVQRDVTAVVVGHGRGGLRGDPAVHPAVGPCLGAAVPGVVEGADVLQVLLLGLRRLADGERQHRGAQRARLFEDGPARGKFDRVAVTEAAYTAQHPEVVIERAILLHQDHHVFDGLQTRTAGPVGSGLCGDRRLERRGQERPRRRGAECAAPEREEPPP